MLDPTKLTEEQQAFVVKYKVIYDKLTSLQDEMDSLRKKSDVLINELQELRKQEKTLFKDGEK